MFSKNLSTALLREMEARNLTQEGLANECHISKRYVGDLVRGHSIPKLDTFEKICACLEMSPEDLLIDKKSKVPDKAEAMQVTKIRCTDTNGITTHKPLCPSCSSELKRDYQAYCDRCGQKLSWRNFTRATVIY